MDILKTEPTRWFTSDTHFGHENILCLGDGRPFKTIGEMNRVLINNAWSVMKPEDTLYHLGDAAMGDFDETVKLLAQMPGAKKYLVPGNHDKVFPKLNSVSRIERFKPMYEAAGYEILPLHSTIELIVNDEPLEVLLSHVPYSPERYGGRTDKLAFARPEDEGLWLIHGHTHSESLTSENPRELHVGVDANDWTPVSEFELVERIVAGNTTLI